MPSKFCFTVNNPETLLDPSIWPLFVAYVCYQLEVGENGTPHFQGYLQLKQTRSFVQLKLWPGLETAHFEVQRGTNDQARDYCRKESSRMEGPWEYGTFVTGPGARSDLLQVKKMLDDKASDKEIADLHFGSWCRYNRSFNTYRTLSMKHRTQKPKVIVAYGQPGLGKTYSMTHMFGVNDLFPKDRLSGNWWDGYLGQKLVLLDEFSGWMVPQDLNRLCDECPLSGQVKGGFVPLAPLVVGITTNYPPWLWWKPEVSSICLPAFCRRVDVWQLWTEFGCHSDFDNYYDFKVTACLFMDFLEREKK